MLFIIKERIIIDCLWRHGWKLNLVTSVEKNARNTRRTDRQTDNSISFDIFITCNCASQQWTGLIVTTSLSLLFRYVQMYTISSLQYCVCSILAQTSDTRVVSVCCNITYWTVVFVYNNSCCDFKSCLPTSPAAAPSYCCNTEQLRLP